MPAGDQKFLSAKSETDNGTRTARFLTKYAQSNRTGYSPHFAFDRYHKGIHERPTANAEPAAPNVGISTRLRGMLNARPTSRMRSLSRMRPVPAMIWKLIWRRKLKTRKGADQERNRPDSANFVPKKATAKSGPKRPSARLTGIAATAKYFVKNRRIEDIPEEFLSSDNQDTTGNKNAMSGVTRRKGMPMRLR